jgi:acetyl-CoA C-acetyltransferase
VVQDNTPVIVGVGQIQINWSAESGASAPSPQSLRLLAATKALLDCGNFPVQPDLIDRVIVVRTMLDSIPNAKQPFGRCEAPAATLATGLGISNAKTIYSVVGGEQPQSLVNESAAAIFEGEAQAILLAGAEATAAMKSAMRAGIELNWSESYGTDEDRGLGPRLLSSYDFRNGLGAPVVTYPVFEHALRARLGHSRQKHAHLMATVWSRFSEIAAGHENAQYPKALSADFLKQQSAQNFPIADPYLKWHVAQDAVNQGAAILMMSAGTARKAGIDPAKWVFLHGYAEAADKLPSERPDLSRSDAIEQVLLRALAAAAKSIDQVKYLDLYSCFPCAVLLAAEALGIDPLSRDLTVTGGLPFFGGAGNNYSMHAIATLVTMLRSDRKAFGLVLANGGFLSKEAAGVYSAVAVESWRPCDSSQIQAALDDRPSPPLLNETCSAAISSFSIIAGKDGPGSAYIIGHNDMGRIIARTHPDSIALLEQMINQDPVAMIADVEHSDGVNYIRAIH